MVKDDLVRLGDDNRDAPAPVSRLVIEFAGPGMAEFKLRLEGQVSPAQILTAAAWLDWKARMEMDRALQAQLEEQARALQQVQRLRGVRLAQ